MLLKYLIPFERFTIDSALPSTEALEALQRVVEPKKYLRVFDRGEKPFEGEIDGAGFKISRLIGYRNSFLPVVIGRVAAATGGSKIHVVMQMNPLIMIFCAVWLFGVVSIGFGLLAQVNVSQIQASPMLLAPLGMLIFFMLLVNGGFWVEALKQKKMLYGLFQGGV